jgi:hypothetical protein
MPSALSALQSWWLATPEARALVADGKLWYREQPEAPNVAFAMPYATYFRVSESVGNRTTGYAWVDGSVQINLHANTPDAAESLAIALRDLLSQSPANPSGAPLAVGPTDVVHVLDEDLSLDVGQGLGPGGQDCWIAAITLDIAYTR